LRVHREVAMPEPLPVKKKATSCDQYAQTKKRCDRKVPCSSCATKRFVCTYERQTSAANQTPAIAEEAPQPSIEDESFSSDLEVNYDFADDLDISVPFSLPNLPDTEWLDLDWNPSFAFQLPKDITTHSEPSS
jgi:Fungal Zn(2)-Cys(6) binuclear cluster domain